VLDSLVQTVVCSNKILNQQKLHLTLGVSLTAEKENDAKLKADETHFNVTNTVICQSVACRGGDERVDGRGHSRQGGIQRVKLQKFKYCY